MGLEGNGTPETKLGMDILGEDLDQGLGITGLFGDLCQVFNCRDRKLWVLVRCLTHNTFNSGKILVGLWGWAGVGIGMCWGDEMGGVGEGWQAEVVGGIMGQMGTAQARWGDLLATIQC